MKSVILLSGGLDSAVLLAKVVNSGDAGPLAIAFDYGQRHGDEELWSSYQIAHYYGAVWQRVNLPTDIFRGSALTGGPPVPHAHCEDPAQAATVVPNRNMVMLSVATAIAVREGCGRVLFGAHGGDAAIYPDCRHGFILAMDRAARLAWDVKIEAPFVSMTKRDIVNLGRHLRVPLDMTWSCYEGGDRPCGECGACREREEAMAA